MKKEITNKNCCVRHMPNLIVSCRDKDGKNNALAVGFAANVSCDPAMVMIGIVSDRFSHHMIKESGEFVINLTPKGMQKEYYYLGTKSGRDEDKFASLNLAWENGDKVNAPLLSACPVNIECKVIQSIQPGSHELFIASVEALHCEETYLDAGGNIDWGKMDLL